MRLAHDRGTNDISLGYDMALAIDGNSGRESILLSAEHLGATNGTIRRTFTNLPVQTNSLSISSTDQARFNRLQRSIWCPRSASETTLFETEHSERVTR